MVLLGERLFPLALVLGRLRRVELRDGELAFGGKGALRAVENVNGEITQALKGSNPFDQTAIDEKMKSLDGTPNKARLGANAILAVSLAVAKAAAKSRGVELYQYVNSLAGNPAMCLPMPMINVMNGGQHALGATDFHGIYDYPD